MTAAARQEWIDFYNKHANEQEHLTGDIAAAWSKLEGYAARLALILHLLKVASEDAALDSCKRIDERTMRSAISITRWFCNETRRVYATLGMDESAREVTQMVEVIKSKGGEVILRDWYRSRSCTKEEGEAELQRLVDTGFAEWFDRTPDGGVGRSARAIRLKSTSYEGEKNSE